MQLKANVFDVWTYRRSETKTEYLLLHTSQVKADRFFNGGRFWQIPSNFMAEGETVTGAVERLLSGFGLAPVEIWAAEYVYNIYNRRFDAMQMIAVYAARVGTDTVMLTPEEHAEFRWCEYDEAQRLVNYRGLKEGLVSVRDYVIERDPPMLELRLK
jgi:ADP-ribose pyrophosphatase YjhB (NUDIX family)